MTKRLRNAVRVELATSVLKTEAGEAELLHMDGRRWRLSAVDIARIQAADLLEDVPEPKAPGQRLAEALDAESVSPSETYYDRVAARLGIKPEGER